MLNEIEKISQKICVFVCVYIVIELPTDFSRTMLMVMTILELLEYLKQSIKLVSEALFKLSTRTFVTIEN